MKVERVSPDLTDAVVLSPDGESVQVGGFWRDQTVVIGLVRHFG